MYEISEDIIGLLVNNEGWLMDKVFEYAHKHDYTKYFSIHREAWRILISEITESIVKEIKIYGINSPELNPDDDYRQDPVSSFGVKEAKRHRKQGVTMQMYLGLMKYYRQSYVELINKTVFDSTLQHKYILFINRCFDRIELGSVTEWNGTPEKKKRFESQSSVKVTNNETNKYLTIFKRFFSPVILLDHQNKIVSFNLEASKLFSSFGISGKIYNDDNSFSFAPREVINKINELIDSNDEEASLEIFIDTIKGKRFFQVLFKKIVDVDENFKGTVIMFNDLTHHKEIEKKFENAMLKAEEADQLKTAFLANMSHEIRTPMNAILGFTEILLNTNHSNKERSGFLKLIKTSSNDLLTIIEDLIDIAKIESKQLKIKNRPCRLYDIMLELQALLLEVLKRFGINDTVELRIKVNEADKNLIIHTDRERLKQVLSNLLNNAAKFTDEGFIEFGYNYSDPSGILFFVRDSGIGIPAHMKDNIFNRFAQIESNNRKNYRGAGLGLTICKNIVSLLGGNIWVESIPDNGSSFEFRLPLLKVPEELNKKPDNKTSQIIDSNVNWSDKNILIAEDDDSNFYYLSELLKVTRINIFRAKNGLEAINIAESEERIHCILMDIKMPEISGIEAAKFITRIRPEIPVIAQTAFALDGDRERCMEAGCCAYITKPVRKETLFILLDKYLKENKLFKMKSTAFQQ
jgi:signal transduction histidine kinase/CheY-like chemotaxis protein